MNRYLKSSVKVLALGAMFGTLPVFAEGADCANSLKGFTVGVDVAYNHAAAKHEQLEATITPSANAKKEDQIRKSDTSHDSLKHKRCHIDPSINVGYTHIYNSWYVGASGEFSFGSKSKRTTEFGGGTTADTEIARTSYGLKLKGGYFVKDLNSAIYVIAGIKWKDVKFNFNAGDVKGSSAKLKRPLYVIGLGVEHPICNKVSVSAEYEYAWRNSEATSFVNGRIANASLFAKQRLNDHNIKVGVKYHI